MNSQLRRRARELSFFFFFFIHLPFSNDENISWLEKLLFFCMCSLTGRQLLPRARCPGRDYARADRALNAANHFSPGAGSWGKVPHQVGSVKTVLSADVLERWRRGGGEERGWERAGRLSVAQYVHEINGELLAWKRRRRIDPLS